MEEAKKSGKSYRTLGMNPGGGPLKFDKYGNLLKDPPQGTEEVFEIEDLL